MCKLTQRFKPIVETQQEENVFSRNTTEIQISPININNYPVFITDSFIRIHYELKQF